MNKNWYFKHKDETALKIALNSKEVELCFKRLKEIFDQKLKDKKPKASDLDKENWEGRMALSVGYELCIEDLYSYIVSKE